MGGWEGKEWKRKLKGRGGSCCCGSQKAGREHSNSPLPLRGLFIPSLPFSASFFHFGPLFYSYLPPSSHTHYQFSLSLSFFLFHFLFPPTPSRFPSLSVMANSTEDPTRPYSHPSQIQFQLLEHRNQAQSSSSTCIGANQTFHSFLGRLPFPSTISSDNNTDDNGDTSTDIKNIINKDDTHSAFARLAVSLYLCFSFSFFPISFWSSVFLHVTRSLLLSLFKCSFGV